MNEELDFKEAVSAGAGPIRSFMLTHTRESDLAVFAEISGTPAVDSQDETSSSETPGLATLPSHPSSTPPNSKFTIASRRGIDELRERYGETLWDGVIPIDTKFRDASRAGKPLPVLAPHTHGSQAYGTLLDDLLRTSIDSAAQVNSGHKSIQDIH